MSQELVSFLNFTFKNNQVETKVIDDYSTKVTKAIRWQLNWREYLSDLAKQGIYADMEHRPSLRRYSSPQPSEELYKDLSAFQNEMRQTIADIVETRKIPPNLWKRILKESDGFTVMLSPPGSFEGDITPRNIGDLNLQYTYDAPTYRNCIMGILRDLIVSGGIFKLRTYPDGRFYYDPNLQAPPGGTLDNSLGPIDNVCPADDFPAPTPVEENPQEVRFSFMISDLEEPSPPPRPKSPPNTNRHLGDQNNSKGILPPPALASNEVAPLDSLLLTNPLSDEAPLELKNPVQDPLNVPNTKDQGDDEVLELTSFNKELVQESQEAPLSEEAQLEDLKGFSGIIENLKGPSDKELALTPTESLTEGELLLSSGPAPEEELIPDAPISLSLEPQNGHPSQEKTAQYQTADAQADDLTDDHNYAKADDLTTLDLTSPLTEAPTETLVSSPPDQSVPKTQDDNTGYQTDFKNPSCDDILDLSVAISAPMEDTSDSEELLLSAPYAESMDEALDTTGGQEQLEVPAASYAPEILESSDITPYESHRELKEPTSEITKEAPFLDAASPSLPQESSLASSPIEAPMPLEETEASFHEPLELQGALQEEGDLEQKVLSDNSTPPAETHKSSSEMAAAQAAPDTMVEPRALELTNALTEESQDPPLEESADDSTSSALAPRDSEKIPELSDANAPSIPLVTETGEISEEAVMKLFVSLKSDETSNEDEDDEPLSLTEEATSEEPLSLTQEDTSEEPLSLTEEDTGEEPLSLTDRDSEDKMEHSALMAEKAPAKLDSYFDLEILMAEMEAEKLKALEDDSLASDLDLDGFSLEALDNALDNLADGPSGGVDPLELSDRYIEGPLEMEQERATFTSEEQQDEILSVALLPQEEEYNLSGQEENEDDYEEYEDDDYLEPADFLPVEFLLCTLEQRSFKKMGMDQNPFLN